MGLHVDEMKCGGGKVSAGGVAAGIGVVAGLAAAWIARWRRFPVAGKVVVVTGGSRGLGLAVAEALGQAGARLVIAARDEKELARAKELLVARGAALSSDDVTTLVCDLTDRASAERMIEDAIAIHGRVDVLVNNAGIITVGPVENQRVEAFRDAMELNYFGVVYPTLAVLPHMLERGRGKDGTRGSIVNICSIGGKLAVPHMLPYSASKFAAVGFSQGLHAELRCKGVRVTTVCPGLMRTGSPGKAKFVGRREEEYQWFALSASTPGLACDAGHAAEAILGAVQSGAAEITITPQAAIGARLGQVLPEVTSAVMAAVNTFALPRASGNPADDEPKPGSEVAGKASVGGALLAETRWNQ